MKRQALAVDELLSFAVGTGDTIRVHLRLRDDTIAPGSAVVRLRAGRRTHDAPAKLVSDDLGTLLTCEAPRDLGRQPWQLVLRRPDEEPRKLQARLLAAPGQPVALLAGPAPATEMSPPAPHRPPSTLRRAARHLPEPVKRVLRRGRDLR